MHPNFIILVVITCYILGVIGIVITNYVVCELGLLALICNVLLEGTDGTRNKYLDSLIASIIKVVPKWCPVCSLEIIICTLLPTKCFIKIKQVKLVKRVIDSYLPDAIPSPKDSSDLSIPE